VYCTSCWPPAEPILPKLPALHIRLRRPALDSTCHVAVLFLINKTLVPPRILTTRLLEKKNFAWGWLRRPQLCLLSLIRSVPAGLCLWICLTLLAQLLNLVFVAPDWRRSLNDVRERIWKEVVVCSGRLRKSTKHLPVSIKICGLSMWCRSDALLLRRSVWLS